MPAKPASAAGAFPITISVIGAKPGTAIEVVPGKTFLPLKPENVDTIGIAEWVPAGDGVFRPMVRVASRWFTVSRRDLRRLNIPISEMTLRRLITSAFVYGMQVSPGVMQFDYFSYCEHLLRVAQDPEFWDRIEPGRNFTNRQRYRQTL
ncbi:MAG: hypothetical protein FJ399_19665 [Verrucomicrobia bacterium]|nr:hypothetical protein [Verrucomicrobiota bacterium]